METVTTALPLPALLSHALVAFTIEFDNEFERRMPHSTTGYGRKGGAEFAPWLGSLVLWSSCMRFVGDEGITPRELERQARTKTNLAGMERWGYVFLTPDPADQRVKPRRQDWLIRATAAGRRAREVWEPLFGEIEARWETRFGKEEVDTLREGLRALAVRMDAGLPDCMPILGYGLLSRTTDDGRKGKAGGERAESGNTDGSGLSLPALLSRVLLSFAMEFESESKLSLAISANVLRVLDETGVRTRDLPVLSGVSKESIQMAMGILEKFHLAVVKSDTTAGRTKVVRLTSMGRDVQDVYRRLVKDIEVRWQKRFGEDAIRKLRASLETLVGEGMAERSPLFPGLEPYPDGWRAAVRRPETLPHYPMVLHRGGYPDGS